MEASLITRWLLVINSRCSPSPSLEAGVGLGAPQSQAPRHPASSSGGPSSLRHLNSGVLTKALTNNNRCSFYFCGSE